MAKDETVNHIGRALAGHSFRDADNVKKAKKYDNPLTDFVNLMIAQCKASAEIKANNK